MEAEWIVHNFVALSLSRVWSLHYTQSAQLITKLILCNSKLVRAAVVVVLCSAS